RRKRERLFLKALRYRWNRSSETGSPEGFRHTSRSLPSTVCVLPSRLASIVYSTTGGDTGVAPERRAAGAAASAIAARRRAGLKWLKLSRRRILTAGARGVNRIRGVARRTAFLTGGTGFVGAHVARALGEEGWSVRALARRPEALAAEDLRDLSLESVAGDLSHASESALREGARGVEAIVHVAGLVKARSLEAYREVNAGGTVQLLRAAAQSAPDALFVLVSSQAAAGPARNGRPVEEGDPAAPVSWYGRSKLEAEEAVASEWKGPWIVLRPVVVYGAGVRGLLRLFAAARRGWVPVPAGRSRVQLIEAPRAARAIALCAGRPDLSGQTAFLGDPESVEISDLSAIIASLPQKPARRFPVPD